MLYKLTFSNNKVIPLRFVIQGFSLRQNQLLILVLFRTVTREWVRTAVNENACERTLFFSYRRYLRYANIISFLPRHNAPRNVSYFCSVLPRGLKRLCARFSKFYQSRAMTVGTVDSLLNILFFIASTMYL